MSIRIVAAAVFVCHVLGCAAPQAAEAPVVAAPTTARSYYVGGRVTGLRGVGLVLRTAHGDHAFLNADGDFAFSVPLENGAAYTVSIESEPFSPLQSCVVEHPTGRIQGKDADELLVMCSTVTL